MPTRRTLGVLLALAVVGLGGFAASAAIGQKSGAQAPAPVERVAGYDAVGSSAEYHGDSAGMTAVEPLRWTAPGESELSAVVEVSLQYRTRGKGPFFIAARTGYEDGTENGFTATTRPGRLTLRPAPDGTSTTVRFLVPAVEGGTTYDTFVHVNTVSPPRGTNAITARKVLVTVDLAD